MKQVWLILPLLVVCQLPLQAQSPKQASSQQTTNAAVDAQVREAVIDNWLVPKLTSDAIITVNATLLPGGTLANPQLSVGGVQGSELNDTRTSFLKALSDTKISSNQPVGPVSFEVEARTRAGIARCYPLRVYLPTTTTDSKETIPTDLEETLQKAVVTWNKMAVSYSKAKTLPPYQFVDSPEKAEVIVEAYANHPSFSAYLIDDLTKKIILRIPVKVLYGGMVSTGLRWWSPGAVKQIALFEFGRLLGLGLSNVATNVLYPDFSREILTTETQDTQTSDVSVYAVAQDGDPYFYQGVGTKTVNSNQLQAVDSLLQSRVCPNAPKNLSVQGIAP
ncbi:hypothetical protein [Gloeobacter morelensis]|uniref:Uncharacterized protein n=1 Tax=Gloeobacter morelensis MG652769 TaxID=2781736 RepID=A0ABY3PPE0_9CYAN|nr:hypothetical protein [Gloeobacter morelensis]UFP95573.1 hypothetical protein ISF26_04825 [Gloeobacter morelensis MG652769]